MDWMTSIALIIALISAATASAKAWKTEKEAALFAEQVEEALDKIISGKEFCQTGEMTEDTLWGKCGEKFWRLYEIWEQKESDARKEKQQMKTLISDISHQTKTPLANMRLYLEFLQEESLSTEGEAFLRKLGEQESKLDFLLQSMVKMSRLESGVIQIKSETTDLYPTLAAAVGEIVPAAAKKEIELHVHCEEHLRLRHDRKWTEEAIFNVLDNAVKYSDVGGCIHISVVRQEIFTKISIQDTGKGIPSERYAEIFTRFYREPEVHDKSGVGIGLYLTRRILELQNGYVEVRSRVGKGSRFCLYLPNE